MIQRSSVSCAGVAAIVMGSGAVGGVEPDASPYVRVVTPDEQSLRLELAIRTLVPKDGAGPVIHLVGAMHIGDAEYYDAMQAYLDVHDVVLYEGVGGAREPRLVTEESLDRAKTQHRLRFVGLMAFDAAQRTGAWAKGTSDLLDQFTGSTRTLLEASLVDGWGHAIQIEARGDGVEVISVGADGKPGGEGEAGDMTLSQVLDALWAAPAPEAVPGLQRDMAHALGLEFQLEGIDYGNAHWRNSDLSMAEIQAAISGRDVIVDGPADEEDAEAEDFGESTATEKTARALFSALAGDSMLAKTGGTLMRMLGSSARGRSLVKVMLADVLSQADALMGAQPGPMRDLMKVIIDDRNVAVVRDLAGILADEREVRSVAVFYGVGHFADLEARIMNDLAYTWESTMWMPAMTVDLRQTGLSRQQLDGFRSMMRASLEQQLRAVEP